MFSLLPLAFSPSFFLVSESLGSFFLLFLTIQLKKALSLVLKERTKRANSYEEKAKEMNTSLSH